MHMILTWAPSWLDGPRHSHYEPIPICQGPSYKLPNNLTLCVKFLKENPLSNPKAPFPHFISFIFFSTTSLLLLPNSSTNQARVSKAFPKAQESPHHLIHLPHFLFSSIGKHTLSLNSCNLLLSTLGACIGDLVGFPFILACRRWVLCLV